jgi:hypothetical protein
MKHYITLLLMFAIFGRTSAQLKIEPSANWITTGNPTVVLNDMSLINSGTMAAGSGSFKFTGSQNTGITGVNLPSFYTLEIAKTNNSKVSLARDISVSSSLIITSGFFDLWSSKAVLSAVATISGETEVNRIIGGTGFIEITQNLNSPNGTNPGGLGAFITSSANLGSVTVRRGHFPQSGTGLTSGINRYYSIIPANNIDLNATLRLKYFDAELNGQNENSLVLYQGVNGSFTWNNLSRTSNSATANYVEKTGLSNFSFQTLANDNSIAGAVTGLVFTGSRKKATDVQLSWTTQTETNMSGFQVQRRFDTEVDFSDRSFVNTKAPAGNSTAVLSYQAMDANAHTGMSYYRLKIVDKANNVTYSPIINVAGKTKAAGGGNGGGGNGNNRETSDDISAAEVKVTVGPNPNNGNFWFVVSGIEKETSATLFTIDGKVMKQFRVFNMQQEKIYGLSVGVYLLNVAGMKPVKIIVQ